MPESINAKQETAARVALVTGASSGIGRRTAAELARNGFLVYAAARRWELLKTLATEVNRENLSGSGSIVPFSMDVTLPGDISRAVAEIEVGSGRLDFLFNNAGMGRVELFAETSLDLWKQMIDTNLTSVFLVTRAFLPLLRKGSHPVIVNHSSIAASTGFPGFSAYSAAKAGVSALSRVLREELRGEGIRVMTIRPGATDSGFWNGLKGRWDREKMMAPETIAKTVASLAMLPPDTTVEELVIMPSSGSL